MPDHCVLWAMSTMTRPKLVSPFVSRASMVLSSVAVGARPRKSWYCCVMRADVDANGAVVSSRSRRNRS